VDELIRAEQSPPKSCLFQEICILLFYCHRPFVSGFSLYISGFLGYNENG